MLNIYLHYNHFKNNIYISYFNLQKILFNVKDKAFLNQ